MGSPFFLLPPAMPAEDNTLCIYLMDTHTLTGKALDDWTQLLDQEETHYARSLHAGKRPEYIGSRALLKTILGKLLDMEPGRVKLQRSNSGKLYIPGVEFTFSLSHSNNRICLATGKARALGVDTENTLRKADFLKIARRFFHPEEFSTLQKFPPEEQQHYFLLLWTLKEAAIKLAGKTIAGTGLHNLCFRLESNSMEGRLPESLGIPHALLASTETAGQRISLAWQGEPCNIELHTGAHPQGMEVADSGNWTTGFAQAYRSTDNRE